MNRRRFLFLVPWVTLAPKAVLETLISIPEIGKGRSMVVVAGPSSPDWDTIIANELNLINTKIPTLFERDDVFFSMINRTVTRGVDFSIPTVTQTDLDLLDYEDEL